MAIMFFSKATRGWNSAIRELRAGGKPLPKKMREALAAGVRADRIELDDIQAAIELSEQIERTAKRARGHTNKQHSDFNHDLASGKV